MIEVAKVISLIKKTSGYNDKKYLLKKNADVPGLKEVLRFIYDPYNRTGISGAKLNKGRDFADAYVMGDEPFISYTDAIKYFKRYNTGTDRDLTMAARFISCTTAMYGEYPFTIELAKAIVTQDLQIGVTANTLNAVYGNHFIPIVGCMLGTKLSDISIDRVQWPCVVTEKLDGIRRILVKEDGVCRMFSRSGHEDSGLVDILAEAAFLPDNRVYDGELLALGVFNNSIELRQVTSSLSAIKGTKRNLSYNIFDMLPVDEFYYGLSMDTAAVRKAMLAATLMDESLSLMEGFEETWPQYIASYGIYKDLSFIKTVPILGYVHNMTEVAPIVEQIWAQGGEGVMLNTVGGLYEIKRSKSLLKVKHTEEVVLKIVGMAEGTGKFEEMLGALIVDYKGNKVSVGSGFNNNLRQTIWDNPEDYIGKSIEIDTFGESKNQFGMVSLNCPIFKRFVGEVE